MALETATYINQLNPLWPTDATDYVSTGDDHLRLIKSSIQSSFPRVTGPITASQNDLTNVTYLADTGTANALVVTFSPVWTSYTVGKGVLVKVAATNTGAATINVNGLGATAIVGQGGQALIGGELFAGDIVHLTYSTAGFRLLGASGYTKKVYNDILPYTGTNAGVRNLSNGTLTLGTNGVTNLTCNAAGSVTIPTLTGTTATITTINATTINATSVTGVIPAGTTMLFYEAAAPVGWTRTASLDGRLCHIGAAAAVGGTDNPVLMNKVVSHTHTFTTGAMSANATHNHSYSVAGFTVQYASGAVNQALTGLSGGTTGTEDLSHTHSGTTAVPVGADTWNPLYATLIACNKN